MLKKTIITIAIPISVIVMILLSCNVEISVAPNNTVSGSYSYDNKGNLWIGNQVVVQGVAPPNTGATICLTGHGDIFMAGGISGNKGGSMAQFVGCDWAIVSIQGTEIIFVNGGVAGP